MGKIASFINVSILWTLSVATPPLLILPLFLFLLTGRQAG
jgi:hypothetical protein